MSWVKGDLITATKLNEENSIQMTISYSHQGWSYRTTNVYFLCTRPAEDTSASMIYCSSTGSVGANVTYEIYRRENGSWVQKMDTENFSPWSGTVTHNYPSYGIGIYRFYMRDHNNTPTITFRAPCRTCVKGNLLLSTSVGPYEVYDSESDAISASLRQAGTPLTAENLNRYMVYTL